MLPCACVRAQALECKCLSRLEALDPLGLEFQAIVSYLSWELGIKLRPSAGTTDVLNVLNG